jgi:hypothetical protein
LIAIAITIRTFLLFLLKPRPYIGKREEEPDAGTERIIMLFVLERLGRQIGRDDVQVEMSIFGRVISKDNHQDTDTDTDTDTHNGHKSSGGWWCFVGCVVLSTYSIEGTAWKPVQMGHEKP